MSASPSVEIDFFRLKDEPSSHNNNLSSTDHRRSDIQGVISKINPELLKTAIASATAKKKTSTNFANDESSSSISYPHLQTVYNKGSGSTIVTTVAPLTIFYNGSVSVFDVSAHQADKIMKFAAQMNASSASNFKKGGEVINGTSTTAVSSSNHQNNNNDNKIGEELLGGVLLAGRSDLPMSRKKSLRRFLEKRKERQVTINPYACSQGNEC